MELEVIKLGTGEELAVFRDTFALSKIAWLLLAVEFAYANVEEEETRRSKQLTVLALYSSRMSLCRPDQLKLVSHRGLEPGFCF